MRSNIQSAVARVPPLDPQNPYANSPKCKICGATCLAFDVVDFNKFCVSGDFYRFGLSCVSIYYWRCRSCGFLFTDFFDDWTPADFSQFVYNKDYVKVDPEYVSARPTRLPAGFSEWLRSCEAARILDYGSGAGVFVEQMRALGYERVEGYDPFLARGAPRGDLTSLPVSR